MRADPVKSTISIIGGAHQRRGRGGRGKLGARSHGATLRPVMSLPAGLLKPEMLLTSARPPAATMAVAMAPATTHRSCDGASCDSSELRQFQSRHRQLSGPTLAPPAQPQEFARSCGLEAVVKIRAGASVGRPQAQGPTSKPLYLQLQRQQRRARQRSCDSASGDGES